MENKEGTVSVPVLWRGKKYVVDINSEASVKEFGDEVQKLTNVKADTMKLIVPQSSGKTSRLLEPFSSEHSCIRLKDTEIVKAKSIRMMGVLENEVEDVLRSAKENSRIVGFEEEEKRMRQRMSYGRSSYPKLPEGPYVFCGFKTLEIPGIELNPPPSEALKRLHMLAADPGIVAIMNKHRWRVGIMTELAPVGYVGVSPKCILGFNKNQGEEISLRLRTDDLKGFRKYESIKRTLLHELAHMVYTEHDDNFKALDKQLELQKVGILQCLPPTSLESGVSSATTSLSLGIGLNQEAVALDWTRSGGHTLSGVSFRDYDDVDAMLQSETSGSHRLGGESASASASARAASVAAAYHRLAEAKSVTPKEDEEPDPDDSSHKINENETIVIMDNPGEKKIQLDCKPDPDQSLQDHVRFEPDPDESATDECMEFESSHHEGTTKVEPDPDDTEMSEALRSAKTSESLEEQQHEEPDPDDSETSKIQQDEPDPDDKVDEDNGELQRIQDPVAVFCDRLTKAIETLRAEVNPTDGALILQTLFKIIRNLLENPSEMKYRRLRKANPVFQKSVANHKAAMGVLFLVGFTEDIVHDEVGTAETYLVMKRDDPGLLWLAKSSLEMRIA